MAYSGRSAWKSDLLYEGAPAGVGDIKVDQDRFSLEVVIFLAHTTPPRRYVHAETPSCSRLMWNSTQALRQKQMHV